MIQLRAPRPVVWLVCGVAALLVLSGAVAAQEPTPSRERGQQAAQPATQTAAQPGGDVVLSTLTVTATRTERALEEVPESVSVVDQETLTREQVQSLDDVLRTLPNVDTEGGPRRVRETPVIRGLGGNRVVTRIDGVRQGFQSEHKGAIFLEPDLLKSVEVVRGPASALYGSDALGGVLSLTSKDAEDFLLPDQRHGVQLRAGFQSANQEQMASPAIYGRLGEATSYLLHVTRRASEDLRVGGGDILAHSAESSSSIFAKLRWNTSANDAWRLSVRDYAQAQEVPLVGEADDPAGTTVVDRAIRTRTARLSFDAQGPVTGSWHPAASIFAQRLDIDETLLLSARRDHIVWDTIGFDVLNSSRLEGDRLVHTLTYGLEHYADEETAERNGSALPVFPDAQATRSGVYVQDELELASWRITPGARFDAFTSEARDVAGVNENRHLSPKLGVVYAPTPGLSLHALYAEGFRAPTIQELYISGFHHGGAPEGIFVPNPELRPEAARNVEAGFTLSGGGLMQSGDRWKLRLAAFRNRITDFIETDVTFVRRNHAEHGVTCVSGGGCLFYRPGNISSAELTGGELEAQYDGPGMQVRGSYARTRGTDLGANDPINSIPPDKWVLEAQATVDPRWRAGARIIAAAAQDRVTDEDLATPGYATVDLFATLQPEHGPWRGLRVDAGVDNVADTSYRRHLSLIREAGRNYKLTATYRF